MRPLIQYDLDGPPTVPSAPVPTESHSDGRGSPSKKRKRNHRHPQKTQSGPPQKVLVQHWDDPGSAAVGVVYDEEVSAFLAASNADDDEEGGEEEVADADEEEEESRELTHEEIWDDSALVDAWNSAEAEYEAYHGTSKSWKTEPVKRSPLWYNKPYTSPAPSKRSNHIPPIPQAHEEDGEPEPDTAPLDFDTFVPAHDPSLSVPSVSAGPSATAPCFVSPPSTTASRDEAFNNALSAMYWSGYWTAVYHCQSRTTGKENSGPGETTEEDGIEADGDEEDLVPAQR